MKRGGRTTNAAHRPVSPRHVMRQGTHPGRIQSVDTLRSVAIFAVIAIHTTPFESRSSSVGHALDLATAVNQAARFAVPFFFVLSGYFWAGKFKGPEEIYAPTMAAARRIGYIFIAWSIVYLLPWNVFDSLKHGLVGPIKVVYWNLGHALSDPLTTA